MTAAGDVDVRAVVEGAALRPVQGQAQVAQALAQVAQVAAPAVAVPAVVVLAEAAVADAADTARP